MSGPVQVQDVAPVGAFLSAIRDIHLSGREPTWLLLPDRTKARGLAEADSAEELVALVPTAARPLGAASGDATMRVRSSTCAAQRSAARSL